MSVEDVDEDEENSPEGHVGLKRRVRRPRKAASVGWPADLGKSTGKGREATREARRGHCETRQSQRRVVASGQFASLTAGRSFDLACGSWGAKTSMGPSLGALRSDWTRSRGRNEEGRVLSRAGKALVFRRAPDGVRSGQECAWRGSTVVLSVQSAATRRPSQIGPPTLPSTPFPASASARRS